MAFRLAKPEHDRPAPRHTDDGGTQDGAGFDQAPGHGRIDCMFTHEKPLSTVNTSIDNNATLLDN
jgi:hypothetical protein